MAQETTTIQMDGELKQRFASLCKELGMSVNTAFTLFAKAVVRCQGIPFKIELDKTDPHARLRKIFWEMRESVSDLPEMSLDEINAEIQAVRSQKP
ncbi:MAG: type II toxin-antitoxin system RelB/DinJ family antitoxin [Bacteroidales bacterium]|nr:type II toxin-antitoxin system RelB/DinJ family antitoxin [Bacteroidales bacterium]